MIYVYSDFFFRTVSERQRAILEEFEKEITDENSTSSADGW